MLREDPLLRVFFSEKKKVTRGVADAAKAAGLDTASGTEVDSLQTLRQIQRGLVDESGRQAERSC